MIFLDVFCRMAETLPPFSRERLASNSPRNFDGPRFSSSFFSKLEILTQHQQKKKNKSTTGPNAPERGVREPFVNRSNREPRDLPWQLDLSTTNCFTSSVPGFSLTDGTFTDDGKLGCSCACDTQNPCQVESEIWKDLLVMFFLNQFTVSFCLFCLFVCLFVCVIWLLVDVYAHGDFCFCFSAT